ncbi:DNA repair protein RAD51 [Phytophthora infestans T30-4]|uniref:DNA repair protein RAD51 homolog 3 n=1 Tax=Phytophthora infestans (strain T30-4) TaxID=403677 RepID=D0NBD6_PHYIT|nr:DNA repair protein RAD51 [Phytophthora infestans T30-4]EEY55365.1 DNA repair protein RAD51 [Phytophthora infestans T30-4]|eukprot:XP_002903589.1 DNA repair protein RAD51 [Phytophthora infestans T30-4]
MDVPLAARGLAPSVLVAFLLTQAYGVVYLVDISARELASEAEISVDDAVGVLEIARHEKKTTTVGDTALDLLQEVTKSKPIATRLLGLDGLLGGGLQLGEVTEICRFGSGGPGSGKTQFGIHACLAAQYAVDEAGKKSSAVFIDSEGSFIIERVASMAKHFLEDFRHLGADKLTRDDLLRGITYYRVHDFLEQVEILHSLPSYLQATPECKLLVIDTVAFHFRHGFEDYTQRARALDELALFLHGLATDFDLAVLLINHITTKSSSNNRQVSQERPALGEFLIV